MSVAKRRTAAARLLSAVVADDEISLGALAAHLRLSVATLEDCVDGIRPLELEAQLRLAALVCLVAPRHERLARALYAQAQAAMRVAQASPNRHMTYPKEHFR